MARPTAILAAPFAVLCLLGSSLAALAAPDEPAYAGVVSMGADRTILIQWLDDAYGPDLTVKPGDRSYESYRTDYGDLNPGDAILMPYTIGSVWMAEDGVLTLQMNSLGPGAIAHIYETAKPGDPEYRRWLDMVGGLRPGASKPIFGYGLKPRPVDPKVDR